MKKFASLLCLLMGTVATSFSQSDLPAYGTFSQSEVEMKECAFDKNADAVIIFDEGSSTYDDSYSLVTTRRIRIKILNNRGIERGDIVIPFYSKDHFEQIQSVDAVSYNPGSTPERSYLNKRSVYTEKVNDHISRIKFAIPNVKAGTILEYKYVSVMKHYGGLDEWLFQSDLPTMRSCYLLQIIPNAEFNYVIFKKDAYKATVIPKQDAGQIYYEMDNIPGLRFEPYMDAARDYFQKVQFQLSSYMTMYGTKKKVYASWDDISKTMSSEDGLGGTLKKDLTVPADLQAAVMQQTTNEGKIEAVYNYVNNNFTANGYDSKYASESLKKIAEKRSGTNGEINLVMINYLQSFHINAFPLIAADRGYGAIDPRYPLTDRFNKTVAYISDGDKEYILDATEKYLPLPLIPSSLLNTYALVIDKKKGSLLKINSTGTSSSDIHITGTVSGNGSFSGKAEINSFGYFKQEEVSQIRSDKNKYLVEEIEASNDGLKVTGFEYTYSPELTKPLVQQIEFARDGTENGGFLLFNYNIFTGLATNPFKSNERFTNINFGYPYAITVNELIDLPPGATCENLPKDKVIQSADKDIFIVRKISKEGNQLKISIAFNQSVTVVPAASYSMIRELYKEITDMLNEEIVIKVK